MGKFAKIIKVVDVPQIEEIIIHIDKDDQTGVHTCYLSAHHDLLQTIIKIPFKLKECFGSFGSFGKNEYKRAFETFESICNLAEWHIFDTFIKDPTYITTTYELRENNN